MTVFAYLRVSTTTHDQTNENQKKAITDRGFAVDHWYAEETSGTIPALERQQFLAMMRATKEGDTVICTMLDRLGRNSLDILSTVESFKKRGVSLRVMQLDGVDLTSPTGKLLVGVLACLAEMERDNIVQRVTQGIARAKAEGVIIGPPLSIPPATLALMYKDQANGGKRGKRMSYSALAEKYDIAQSTVFRVMTQWHGKGVEYAEEWKQRAAQYAAKN